MFVIKLYSSFTTNFLSQIGDNDQKIYFTFYQSTKNKTCHLLHLLHLLTFLKPHKDKICFNVSKLTLNTETSQSDKLFENIKVVFVLFQIVWEYFSCWHSLTPAQSFFICQFCANWQILRTISSILQTILNIMTLRPTITKQPLRRFGKYLFHCDI